MRDTLAKLLDETCINVSIEPHLTLLTGEQLPASSIEGEEARLDICARGFWQKGQCAFFDVRVFSPFAAVHLNQNLKASFIMTEREKKRQYNRRIQTGLPFYSKYH